MSTPPRTRDALRWPVMAGVLLVLLALGHSYTRMVLELPDGIRALLDEPAAHDGAKVVFPVWFVAGVDGPDRYRVSRVIKDVVVQGDSTGLERGQTITVVGHFRAADSVVVEERHQLHPLRAYKKRLSLVALVLTLVGLPLCLRWRGRYLHLRGDPELEVERA